MSIQVMKEPIEPPRPLEPPEPQPVDNPQKPLLRQFTSVQCRHQAIRTMA